MLSHEQQRGETISSSRSSNTPSAIAEEIRTRLHALSTERSNPPFWAMLRLAQTVNPHLLLSRIRHDLSCLIVPEGSLLEIEDPVLQTLQENDTLQRCLQSLSSLRRTLSSREALKTIDKFSNATHLLKSRIDELQTRGLQNICRQQNRSLTLSQLDNSILYLEFLVLKLDENRNRWNEVEANNIVWELERLVNNCKKIKQEVRLLEVLKGPTVVPFALDETEAVMEMLPDDHESIPSVMEAIDLIERLGTLYEQFVQYGAEAFIFQRIKNMNVGMCMVTRVENALRNTGIANSLAQMSAKAVLEQDGLGVVIDVLQGYLQSDEGMDEFVEHCVTIICSVVREGEEAETIIKQLLTKNKSPIEKRRLF
eukprot:scaffold8529_cov137-Cylindrotheca_fusiformis.AAC.4